MKKTGTSIDITSKLWDYYYSVKLPSQLSRTVEDMRMHGTAVCGIKEIDNSKHQELYNTQLTIAQMVDFFKEGVPIRVIKEKEVQQIYEDISAYIYAWKSRLERGINIGDSPIDDLVLLDRFANTIYEKGKYQFTEEIANSLISKHMANIQRVNSHNFFTTKAPVMINGEIDGVTRINATPEDTIPDRESLGEFFKTRLINLRSR